MSACVCVVFSRFNAVPGFDPGITEFGVFDVDKTNLHESKLLINHAHNEMRFKFSLDHLQIHHFTNATQPKNVNLLESRCSKLIWHANASSCREIIRQDGNA